MRNLLLATAVVLTAAAISASPAQAQNSGGRSFASGSGHGGSWGNGHQGSNGHGDQGRRHRDGRSDDGVVVGTWYEGGQWALYNNRTWESDSFNDWWHDRPDRAYPRWVQNGKCDRVWWSGGGWRC